MGKKRQIFKKKYVWLLPLQELKLSPSAPQSISRKRRKLVGQNLADTTVTKICVTCEEGGASSVLNFTQFIILIQSQEAHLKNSNQGRSHKPPEEHSSKLSVKKQESEKQSQTRERKVGTISESSMYLGSCWVNRTTPQTSEPWQMSHSNVRMLIRDKGKGPTEALYHVANFSIKLKLVPNVRLLNDKET